MKKLQVLKNKKGFTLVEIIVVLIILAILAATGIPSLVGFIEDARGKAYVSEARAAYIALQAIITEDAALTTSKITGTTSAEKITSFNTAYGERFKNMLHPDIVYSTTTPTNTIVELAITDDKISGLVYKNGAYYVKMLPGQTAEVKKTPLTLP